MVVKVAHPLQQSELQQVSQFSMQSTWSGYNHYYTPKVVLINKSKVILMEKGKVYLN